MNETEGQFRQLVEIIAQLLALFRSQPGSRGQYVFKAYLSS